jgi:hypothetical protein
MPVLSKRNTRLSSFKFTEQLQRVPLMPITPHAEVGGVLPKSARGMAKSPVTNLRGSIHYKRRHYLLAR